MCEFTQLYTGNDGFVVRCSHCHHYQLGYAGLMLTLNNNDFDTLCNIVKHLTEKEHYPGCENSRRTVIPTPYQGVSLLLCINELEALNNILDMAHSEMTALSMLDLF